MSLKTVRVEAYVQRVSVNEARARLEQEREARLAQLEALSKAEPAADGVLDGQKDTVWRALIGIDNALARMKDDACGTCQSRAKPTPRPGWDGREPD
ncbi:molecular chaperone DnaK [Streptomyces sp. NPDC004270]